MSDINRVSLPEEFYDVTSGYLLAQPEPQYLYAQMLLSALGTQLPGGPVGLEGRDIKGVGAPYSSAERDRLAMADPLMNSVVVPTVDFKGLPGHTVRFNRPQFADTTYTQASREVAANTTISTTTINAGSEQTALTLKRFAGPYDQTNSRVAPFGLDKFHAQSSVHNLEQFVGTHLSRDHHKFLDSALVVLLNSANQTIRPSGMSADDDATAAGQFPMDLDTLIRTEEAADSANLPTFPDGHRIIVLSPKQLAQLKLDGDYVELSKEHAAYNALFPQYVASVGKLHIFKSTTLSATNNSSSVAIHTGHLICPGTLLGGMGEAPRVASSTDDNYGEVGKVIWIGYYAFGLADDRFVITIKTSA